jgi:hypothetical protein
LLSPPNWNAFIKTSFAADLCLVLSSPSLGDLAVEGEEGRAVGREIWGLETVLSLAEERKGEDDFLLEFMDAVDAAEPAPATNICLCLYCSVSFYLIQQIIINENKIEIELKRR